MDEAAADEHAHSDTDEKRRHASALAAFKRSLYPSSRNDEKRTGVPVGKEKELTAPLVSKLSSFSHPALDLDILAGRVYSLPIKEPERTLFEKQEFSQAPIRYDEDEKRFLNA